MDGIGLMGIFVHVGKKHKTLLCLQQYGTGVSPSLLTLRTCVMSYIGPVHNDDHHHFRMDILSTKDYEERHLQT